jgi:eukaryotic translation initiation factor 2C
MNIENSFMRSASSSAGALSNLSLSGHFPQRPGHGTLGKQIVVYANYFRISNEPSLALTRYNVEISPEAKGRKLARIFELLLELEPFKLVVTDTKSMIISRIPLNIPNDYVVEIPYRGDGEDEPLERATTYKVRIVTPTTLEVGDYTKFLSATTTDGPATFLTQSEIIQGLNTVLGHQAKTNPRIVSIGQNRHFAIDRGQHNAHNIKIINGGLETLRGYFQSIRPAAGGILLNVNVTHGVFLEPIRLSDLLPKCKPHSHPSVSRPFTELIRGQWEVATPLPYRRN